MKSAKGVMGCLILVGLVTAFDGREAMRRWMFNTDPTDPYSNPYGVNVNALSSSNSDADPRLDTIAGYIAAGGIGWVRMGFPWAYIESQAKWPGNDPCMDPATTQDTSVWDWGSVTTSVQRANAHGLNILGVLGLYTPTNESPTCGTASNSSTYSASDSTHWMHFVDAVVGRFPQIHYWEVWNEPNGGAFSGCIGVVVNNGCSIDDPQIGGYAALVRQAAYVIHSKGGEVVGPAVGDGGSGDLSPWNFVGGVMSQAGSSIDAISFHDYGTTIETVADSIRAHVSTSFAARESLWVTEAGYYNNTPTQAQLAANVTARMAALTDRPSVRKVFIWHAYADTNCFGEVCSAEAGHLIAGFCCGGITPLQSYYTYANIARTPALSGWIGSGNTLQASWKPISGTQYYTVYLSSSTNPDSWWLGTTTTDTTFSDAVYTYRNTQTAYPAPNRQWIAIYVTAYNPLIGEGPASVVRYYIYW